MHTGLFISGFANSRELDPFESVHVYVRVYAIQKYCYDAQSSIIAVGEALGFRTLDLAVFEGLLSSVFHRNS